MRTKWLNAGMASTLVLMLVASAGGQVRDQSSTPAKRDGRVWEGRIARVEAAAAAAAAASAPPETGCVEIGAFTDLFSGTNRIRGNVYSLTRNVDLVEFRMELSFDGSVNLFFYIFEEMPGDPNPTFELLSESIVLSTGTGAPTFYSSGPLSVSLQSGKRYAIGVAWTSTNGDPTSVTYGSDGLIYPRPFVAGQVEGLFSINQSPPLTTLGTLVIFRNNGVYSMELCMTGACCKPDNTCEDLSQNVCLNAGGAFTAGGSTCADDVTACPLTEGACCFGATACLSLNQLGCEAAGGTWNEGAACDDPNIQPCAPKGGCCRPDGTCADNVSETRCVNLLDGSYRGNGTTCADFPPCGGGACCAGSTCNVVLTADDCTAAGGLFIGAGVACEPNPCVPTGACCRSVDEVCVDQSEADCMAAAGTYRGDGTTCATLTMPCGRGSCCVDGVGCVDGTSGGGVGVAEAFCITVLTGTFRGDGTTCATIEPRCDGNCCWDADGNGTKDACSEPVSPRDCFTKLGGDFAGYLGVCTTTPPAADPLCPIASTGACCVGDDVCTSATETTCEDVLLGTFIETCSSDGSSCDTSADCPICVGGSNGGDPCPNGDECLGGGTCTGTASCDAATCTTGLCAIPVPTGACCDRSVPSLPSCADGQTQANCTGPGLTWTEATACAALVPACDEGACCNRDVPTSPVCTDNVTAAGCTGINETFSLGATCADVFPPCEPIGACCDSTIFACIDNVVEAACMGPGQTWTQDIACSALAPPCEAPTGACCNDAACTEVSQTACGLAGGNYQGDTTTCSVGLCGACCNLDGTCADNAVEAGCAGPAVFHAGFLCADVCTPRGACCDGSTCREALTAAECTAIPGAIYDGDDSTCVANLCTTGPCCSPSFSTCQDVTLQECNAQGGIYLIAQGPDCATVNPNCTFGVCCTGTGACTDNQIVSLCADPSDFLTTDTLCANAGCTARGACCLPDETCEIRERSACLTDGGVYGGDDSDCTPGDLCQVGACCDSGGACDDTGTRLDCETGGGTFAGSGSVCSGDPDECVIGGCCELDATCTESVPFETCVLTEGDFDNSATDCTGLGACEVRGGCCEGGTCSIQTAVACTGNYLGDGVPCTGADCTFGACCDSGGGCDDTGRQVDCDTAGGTFAGVGSVCSGGSDECVIGSCCELDGTCSASVPFEACVLTEGNFDNANIDCSGLGACEARSACCDAGSCTVQTAAACTGNSVPGNVSCTGIDCTQGACCDAGAVCTLETSATCTNPGDVYQGDGTTCTTSPCVLAIANTNPPDGAIDAREPFDPGGSNPAGWDTIDLIFSGNPIGVTPADFAIETVPAIGVTPVVPNILTAVPVGNIVTLTLDQSIPLEQWTCIRHIASGTAAWLGNLPGDVDGSRTVDAADIAAIVSCLVNPGSCNVWECDIDRSLVCSPQDVLRLIDLLNGVGAFAGVNDDGLPAFPGPP